MIIRRGTTFNCVCKSSSLFKLNLTCFFEWSVVMRHDFFLNDPETKHLCNQSKCPTSPRQKKTRQSKSKIKVLLISFFDMTDIAISEFLPWSQMINQQINKELLWHMLLSVTRQTVAVSPQQCACIQHPVSIPGREEHRSTRITSLFIWTCFVKHFFQVQGLHQGGPFWRRRSHQERPPRRILPAVHRSVINKNGKVN